jgi:hypothetical protein
MTDTSRIQLLVDDEERRRGTAIVNRMTPQRAFTELSAGFADFVEGGQTPEWTAPADRRLFCLTGVNWRTRNSESVGDVVSA